MGEEEAFHDAFHPDPLVVGAEDLQHTAGQELLLHHAHDDVAVADLVQALDNGDVVVDDEHPKRYYEEMTGHVDVIGTTEVEAKRPKKVATQGTPKKLNNEQWDLMFAKLVEYKAQYGVSPFSGFPRKNVDNHFLIAIVLLLLP